MRDRLIPPYGGKLVKNLLPPGERETLAVLRGVIPEIVVPGRLLFDLELLAVGAYSPLSGFMTREEYDSVIEGMSLPSGLPWSIPIYLPVEEEVLPALEKAGRGILVDERGIIVGIVEVKDLFRLDRERESLSVYGTDGPAHPGVAAIHRFPSWAVGGDVKVDLEALPAEFPELRLSPEETRRVFAERGWSRVAAFQTRNPIHRAHEYLIRVALELCDGVLIHPVVGETKKDDIPAEVRVACYRALVGKYLPEGRVLLSVLPLSMRYAGPKEAIHHAIIRRNYGCSHFIVGRDHAGVGNYYGTYAAQEIFDEIDLSLLGVTPLRFEHAFYCRVCDGMASFKTCPHSPEDRVILSGTKVREMLSQGITPPETFTRREVAEILIESYAR